MLIFGAKEIQNGKWMDWTIMKTSNETTTQNQNFMPRQQTTEMNPEAPEKYTVKEIEWSQVAVNDETHGSSFLSLSNPTVPIPSGLWATTDFVTEDQEANILRELENERFFWEGFDQRRRAQRYRFRDNNDNATVDAEDSVPTSLVDLRARLEQVTRRRVQHVEVVEYARVKWDFSGKHASNFVVATFESSSPCQCQSQDYSSCSCLVAQIPLRKSAVQHLNRPKRRSANCWTMESPKHCTDVYMAPRSLLVKTDDCLANWRMRMSAGPESDDSVLMIKFYSLPENDVKHEDEQDDEYGYIPSAEDLIGRSGPMPPLEDLLTIIVTTSPIKSNPSTEMIARTLDTFIHAGPDFAYKCRKLFICDGVRKQDDGLVQVTRKHANEKQAMRNGIVNSQQHDNYELFKEALKKLCTSASETSPFRNGVVEELETRHGYGFALRHGLRHCVTTPFVCVIQHDRTFMRPTPLKETVDAMWHHPHIKYVGMSQRSNLMYKDIFMGKYGRASGNELAEMIERPSELCVDASKYGPDSESTAKMVYKRERLQDNVRALAETYRKSAQYLEIQDTGKHPVQPGKQQLTLTPTLFWYDNTHICETAHYRDFVFHPPYKMVAKGGFVEDKLSPMIKRTVERLGLKEGHSRFGCFLLDDHSGMFFTGHLDGGAYLTATARETLVESQTMSS
jgi:hypothetical protein